MDLTHRKPKDFVFIKFFRVQDAKKAAEEMNNTLIGRTQIFTVFVKNVTYFNQDETSVNPKLSGIC